MSHVYPLDWCDCLVIDSDGRMVADADKDPDVARRIVACMNALADVPLAPLEAVGEEMMLVLIPKCTLDGDNMARRLTACAKACEGLPTRFLEEHAGKLFGQGAMDAICWQEKNREQP